jgi:hypothetical protein
MRTLLVIMGIVVILALVSLPGAAMISKDDMLAFYPVSGSRFPYLFSCCSNDTFRGMNYTSTFDDDGGGSSEPAPPTDPGHAPGSPPPTSIPSLEELIASYINLPDQGMYDYADDLPGSCGDCTPEPWGKGTVTPTPTPTLVPIDSADDSDCSVCRDPGVYCDPSSFSIFPPTPTVEGSMKVTERHVPKLPPYIPSWVTL